jgi:diaminopropionate ammonia-lyase
MLRAYFGINCGETGPRDGGGQAAAQPSREVWAVADGVRHQANPDRGADPWSGPGTDRGAEAIRAAVRADPDYRPSPLHRRPRLARTLGLGAVLIKDEGSRLAPEGLASFKPLGVMGAFAHLAAARAPRPARLVCASDGNFGRAVAWGARRAGIPATIFLPRTVSAGRVAAIRGFGADTVLVAGGYDRAMAAAAAAARAPGVLEMTDTGHGAVTAIPMAIQNAYGVIAEEILDALPPDESRPTHVFVPAGVGGLVAGLLAAFDARLGTAAPAFVSVQPRVAPALVDSLAAGALRPAPELDGDTAATLMLCLACETPSTTAWPMLRARLAHALAIDDALAVAAMRRLADPEDRPAMVAGESGAAAFGALLGVCADPALRAALGLTAQSRVVVLVTEGATDPDSYRRLVPPVPSRLGG